MSTIVIAHYYGLSNFRLLVAALVLGEYVMSTIVIAHYYGLSNFRLLVAALVLGEYVRSTIVIVHYYGLSNCRHSWSYCLGLLWASYNIKVLVLMICYLGYFLGLVITRWLC